MENLHCLYAAQSNMHLAIINNAGQWHNVAYSTATA